MGLVASAPSAVAGLGLHAARRLEAGTKIANMEEARRARTRNVLLIQPHDAVFWVPLHRDKNSEEMPLHDVAVSRALIQGCGRVPLWYRLNHAPGSFANVEARREFKPRRVISIAFYTKQNVGEGEELFLNYNDAPPEFDEMFMKVYNARVWGRGGTRTKPRSLRSDPRFELKR